MLMRIYIFFSKIANYLAIVRVKIYPTRICGPCTTDIFRMTDTTLSGCARAIKRDYELPGTIAALYESDLAERKKSDPLMGTG